MSFPGFLTLYPRTPSERSRESATCDTLYARQREASSGLRLLSKVIMYTGTYLHSDLSVT
jgi:hypothetical protein